jgi:hypothetical protein
LRQFTIRQFGRGEGTVRPVAKYVHSARLSVFAGPARDDVGSADDAPALRLYNEGCFLIDPDPNKLWPRGENTQQTIHSAASQEMLVDDGSGQEAESAADIRLGIPPLNHHLGHDGGSRGRSSNHSAALQ